MERIKIYGERNTGTNFVQRLITRNFDCEVVPGTLVEARPGYRDQFEQRLEADMPDPAMRLVARQGLMDQLFAANRWGTLGWKHAVPPVEDIAASPDRERTLFICVVKNPYAWALSFFRRPYEAFSLTEPSRLLDFVRQPWVTTARDNTPLILDSPIELWNHKVDGYQRLTRTATTLIVRYEDLLDEPAQVLDQVAQFLNRSRDSYEVPQQAVKKLDEGKKDYAFYRDFYLNQRWRAELTAADIDAINVFLSEQVVTATRYELL